MKITSSELEVEDDHHEQHCAHLRCVAKTESWFLSLGVRLPIPWILIIGEDPGGRPTSKGLPWHQDHSSLDPMEPTDDHVPPLLHVSDLHLRLDV